MKILLVDDDSDDQLLFQEALYSINPDISIESAVDGEDALTILATTAQNPDVIFLDINMPRMNGRDCLKILRNEMGLWHLPVFVMSTAISREDEILFTALGAHCVVKPHEYEALVTKLEECLEVRKNQLHKL